MKKYRKFSPAEKVFAKVRGYPPWPARIVGVADESSQPSKMRYHIYFYGTGERAVVKAEDVFSFVENYNGKMGKPRKQKGFNEAMADIESNLTEDERAEIAKHPGEDGETSLVSDDGTPNRSVNVKTPKSTASHGEGTADESVVAEGTPKSVSTEIKGRKRKNDSEPDRIDTSEAKKTKGDDSADANLDDENGQSKQDIVSRSGRKIKQKKFSDDQSEPVETQTTKTVKSLPTKDKPRASTNKGDQNAVKVDENYLQFVFKGETIKIPLKCNRPNFNNPKSPIAWDRMVQQHAVYLKDQILKEEFAPENVTKTMEDWTRDKALELVKTFEEDDKLCSFLRTEGKLLSIDFKIKSSLTLNKADTAACLQNLEELEGLQLTPVMLKKHPEVVETVKRLRRYVGNAIAWNYSDEELGEFKLNAEKIRKKAALVFSKFEKLFFVPSGQSFWSIFSKQLQDFQHKTIHMTEDSKILIVNDP